MTEPASNPAPREKCLVCGAPLLLPDMPKCEKCKSAQDEQCNVCGERMLPKAVFCNQCKSYQQTWRRVFANFALTTSLILAAFAVGSAVSSAFFYIRDYHSDTRFKVASAEKNVLYLNVWNTGNKQSTLLHYHLRFGRIDINDVDLDLTRGDRQDAKNVIASGKPVKLGLWAPHDLVLTSSWTGREYEKAEIEHLLSDKNLRLEIEVEESDDPSREHLCGLIPARLFHTKSDEFAADRISDFIYARW